MKFRGSDTSSRPRRAQRCVLQIIGCLVVRRLHGSSEPVVVDGSAHQQASGEKPVAQISAAVRRWANVSPARVPGACARSCGCDRDPPRAEIEARMRPSYTTTASPARHSKTTALTVQCWRADAYHETFVGGLLLTMANLYTMNGRPLTRRRDDLFTRSGNHIGHVQGERCSALTGDTSARLSAIVWSTAAQTAHTVISVWTTGRCCLELGQRRRLRGLGRGTYDPGLSDEPVLWPHVVSSLRCVRCRTSSFAE